MSRPGYVDRRGSSRTRARRRAWLLATFDPELGDERARCRLQLSSSCDEIVDSATLSVDRIEFGGLYSRDNIQPACKPCQDTQGGLVAAAGGNAHVIESYRAAREAWEQLFEIETHRTYVRGIIQREQQRERRGGRREVTDFLEKHPPPTLTSWLEEHAQAAQAARERDDSSWAS